MKLELTPHRTTGRLITFCGLDGCGKTTLINRLTAYLEELDIAPKLTKQPTPYVRESAIFRTYMDNPNHDQYDYRALSLLCASDRVQHCNRQILPWLTEGETVISDRYFYSCLANLRARGYEKDTWIYEVARSIPRPDVAFFIDVDVETAVARVRSRASERERYIDMELQQKLRREYLSIARDVGGVVISTHQSEEVCFQQVKHAVQEVMHCV